MATGQQEGKGETTRREVIAAAIANARGSRRGIPVISNVLDMLPPRIREEVMDDAAAVEKVLGGDDASQLRQRLERAKAWIEKAGHLNDCCSEYNDDTRKWERLPDDKCWCGRTAILADAPAACHDTLALMKAALAGLSQNATFPADIELAKRNLREAIAKAEGKPAPFTDDEVQQLCETDR